MISNDYKNYDPTVNTYKVKCGGDLEMWESSGWIKEVDPYGWFMWYCRFYLGRRCEDDERQIGRWKNCTGPKGKWIPFGIIQHFFLWYLNPFYHNIDWLKRREKTRAY